MQKSILVTVVLLFVLASAALAMDAENTATFISDISKHFKTDDFEEMDDEETIMEVRGNKYLFMKGVINPFTAIQLSSILIHNPAVKIIVMTQVPGSADDEVNLVLSRFVRILDLWTYIPAKGAVASGGVDFFLAGTRRFVHSGSSMFVHSFAFEDDEGNLVDGITLSEDDEMHDFFLEYYYDIGIPEDFYWFTLETSAEDLHRMTSAEKKQYQVYTDLLEN